MASQTDDTPVLTLLATMTLASVEASSLEGRELEIARIAALVAADAPPASYLANPGADLGLEVEDVQGVLAAVAPIVGTAHVIAAAGNIARALGLALDISDLADEGNGSNN